jgi:hypothetical protein
MKNVLAEFNLLTEDFGRSPFSPLIINFRNCSLFSLLASSFAANLINLNQGKNRKCRISLSEIQMTRHWGGSQSSIGYMISEKALDPCEAHDVWHSKECILFLRATLPVSLFITILIGRNLEFEMFCSCELFASIKCKCWSRLSSSDVTISQKSVWSKINISVCLEILSESCIFWCTSFASEMHWLEMAENE